MVEQKRWFPISSMGSEQEPCGVVPWDIGEAAFQQYLAICSKLQLPPTCFTPARAALLGGFDHEEMRKLLGDDWKNSFIPTETVYASAIIEARYFV